MKSMLLSDIISEFNLIKINEIENIEKITIDSPNVNRPGIHLLGFFGSFDVKRMQVFGEGEMTFLSNLTSAERSMILDKFFSYKIPCAIIARGIEPFKEMIASANKYSIPLLTTNEVTTIFESALMRYLNYQLAPMTTVHGVLVDVYGEGVLIIGESGVGKSETALELIKRGHRFIADDVVEIKKVGYDALIGNSPDIIKHFIEIKGLGLIDIKEIFGIASIEKDYKISMIIKMENWDITRSYDRLGIDEVQMDILGVKLPCLTIPVKPGRNLSVIIETAAINYRQKKLGYNPAKVLNDRVTNEIKRKTKKEVEK
jgi:HPr kinase/phosphorylase